MKLFLLSALTTYCLIPIAFSNDHWYHKPLGRRYTRQGANWSPSIRYRPGQSGGRRVIHHGGGFESWNRHRESSLAHAHRGQYRYYFGTTNLSCMLSRRDRRSVPVRNTREISHSWLLYRGFYFEFGSEIGTTYRRTPRKATNPGGCQASRDMDPAGYSNVSLACLKRCSRKYETKFGPYHILSNNCHTYVNKLSAVLYGRQTCPDWCKN